MWYVIQVRSGTEETIRQQCLNRIPGGILQHCFIPHYEIQRKIRGRWEIRQKILFPGYVFAVTEDLEALYKSLKKVIGMTKLIGTGREIVPLTEAEQQFLLEFGGEEQLVELSEGVIEHSVIRVTSGPLQGKEGYIRRIDRHKRKAWLELELFGEKRLVEAGLEIVSKTG